MVRKLALLQIIIQALCFSVQAQFSVTPLFQNEKPLAISLSFPFKDINKNTNDTIYFPSVLYYKNEKNVEDSIRMSLRARGNFRRKYCFFAPLRISIKKSEAIGSLFAGNKNLKLVLPCHTPERYNELVTLEYICYQLYECVTPYIFNTRLLDITLSDEKNRPPDKTHEVRGFFIEDDNLVAERFNGKVIEEVNLHPLTFHDTSAVSHDFFQYMIGNTDWSVTFHHNAKMIETEPRKYIPIAYDFDMSGMVNPPYATINPTLGITTVQQRLYRGYCRNTHVMQFVRSKFLNLEAKIWDVMNRYETEIHPKTFANRKKFLEEFFRILKKDRSFTENILNKCRKK